MTKRKWTFIGPWQSVIKGKFSGANLFYDHAVPITGILLCKHDFSGFSTPIQ